METEEERQIRRRARLEQMKREKRRRELFYRWGVPGLALLAAVGIGTGILTLSHRGGGQASQPPGQSLAKNQEGIGAENPPEAQGSEDQSQEAQAPQIDPEAQESPKAPEAAESGSSYADSPHRPKSGHAVEIQVVRSGAAYSPRAPFAAHAFSEPEPQPEEPEPTPAPDTLGGVLWEQSAVFSLTDRTADFSETNASTYGIFIDVQSGEILAQREAWTRMNPASMTKMLTVLVAAEHLKEEDLDKTVPITIDITDYSFVNQCSNTGYELDERVTVRDLFYGTILPSGADSALALAIYVAGSHEAFVELMNEKLEQMGLGHTSHFTNCVGVYDDAHYSTAYDMAVILKAAVDNPFCREVMAARTYTTSLTKEHPEGLLISNWFLRRIEDKDTHGEVLCAKTGYVDESGCCAASLGRDKDGREYLCVTADSDSIWTCRDDHVELYQTFLPKTDSEQEGSAP